MAFAPTSSFTPAAHSTANTCRAAPRSARLRSSTVKMNNMEEISQEEYEELLRAAGQPAAAQPAAAKPAGGGGMFGGMFGGGGAAKAAAPAPMAVAAKSDWQEASVSFRSRVCKSSKYPAKIIPTSTPEEPYISLQKRPTPTYKRAHSSLLGHTRHTIARMRVSPFLVFFFPALRCDVPGALLLE